MKLSASAEQDPQPQPTVALPIAKVTGTATNESPKATEHDEEND